MPTATLRIGFLTHGCKVNQYETAAVREAAMDAGAADATTGGRRDVWVVNTCTVTARADQKGRQAIRRLHRRDPEARIVVTGCGVDAAREAYARLPGVAALVGNAGKAALPAVLGLATAAPADRISRFPDHVRAFLKIEDGCHLRCTYCIIPAVRGAPVSKAPADVVREAAGLAAHHAEIVLTGIHLGGWGRDLAPRLHLADLLPRLARVPGLRRLRLSSLEVQEVTPGLMDVLAAGTPCAPHLHLPLQSGSDPILRAMRRGYRAAHVRRTVDALRAAVPGLGLSTDVIVGFPGETEADARATEALARACGIHRIHRFPYSPRPGTPAAALGDPVPAAAKAERAARLAEVEAETLAAHTRGLLGREVEVLVESPDPAAPADGVGYTGCYVHAVVTGAGAAVGRLVRARVTATTPTGVRAVPPSVAAVPA